MVLKIFTSCILGLILFSSCTKEPAIAYPEPLPSGTFLPFLPGIVSTDSFEFNSLFSPDGKVFYFADGNHDIYQTTFDGEQWSSAALAPFAEKEFKECDPAFSPDGNKLYYISTRKRTAGDSTDDFDIWYVERQGEGWSAPQNLEVVNSDSAEYYVSFAKNGNLYFASNRGGGLGSFDIYVSRLVNGAYTTPENVGEAVNNDHFEHDPFISSDERLLIYTSVNREGGFGRGDLYFSVKDDQGNWSQAQNLGPSINGPEYDFCPYITPDGKFFFYSDNKDIKWIDVEELDKAVGN
jgi:Tol biopolymer transport system component